MSANNTARAAKLERRQQALDEQSRKSRAFRRNVIIVLVVLVLVIAASLVITSDLFYTSTTAVTVGNVKYSPAEFDVFYRTTYNQVYSNLYSSFGDSVSYFLDTSKSLEEQDSVFSEDQTWAEYLTDQTKTFITQVTALCADAEANGFALTADAQAELDSQIENLRATSALYGYASLNNFLSYNYGKGVNETVYRKVLTLVETASEYSQSVQDARSYSTGDLSAYYAEHADELDVISYYAYLVSSSNTAFENEADDEAKLSAARAAAGEIAANDELEAFLAACETYGSAPAARSTVGANLSSEISAWLLDAARQNGDHTSIETDSGAYALWFLSRDDNSYHTRSMRHILIKAVADEDGTYSDEAIFAAQARVREIEQEWKENATEEHFAELANSYSEDTGSNTNGGLYEDIAKNTMVAAINDFLFDPETQPGDTTVVEGNNGSYEGWHLVYYVGESDSTYADSQSESALRSADQSAWLESLTANYSAELGSGMKYAKLS